MRNLIIGLFCVSIMILALGAGGDANDPNAEQPPVAADINDLQRSASDLKTAVYFGTAQEVLDQVIMDVNNVAIQAQTIFAKAQQSVGADSTLTAKQKDFILKKLDAAVTQVQSRQNRVQCAIFLKSATDSLDPTLLDPSDPNYVTQVAVNTNCIKWLLTYVGPMIEQN